MITFAVLANLFDPRSEVLCLKKLFFQDLGLKFLKFLLIPSLFKLATSGYICTASHSFFFFNYILGFFLRYFIFMFFFSLIYSQHDFIKIAESQVFQQHVPSYLDTLFRHCSQPTVFITTYLNCRLSRYFSKCVCKFVTRQSSNCNCQCCSLLQTFNCLHPFRPPFLTHPSSQRSYLLILDVPECHLQGLDFGNN